MERDTLEILGVQVDKVNMAQALSVFEDFIEGDSCKAIFTPNPEIIYSTVENGDLRNLLNSADLAIPDGMAIIKAANTLGEKLEERVTGIDFSRAAIDICAAKGKSIYLLGAKPGVAQMAAVNLKKENNDIRVAGYCDGYFKEKSEDDVVNMINESNADFLLVALGSPKQEQFINNHKNELNVKACIGIGGSFDVWSGNIERAPEFFIKHNIEWLYRTIKEPARLKRIWKIPKFLKLVKKTSRKKQ